MVGCRNWPVMRVSLFIGLRRNGTNIAAIVWGYYNKFDSMKSLGIYYWYVKMPRCGCLEHGLEYLSFYVQKHIADLAACSGPPTGFWRAARGTRISETCLFPQSQFHFPSSAQIMQPWLEQQGRKRLNKNVWSSVYKSCLTHCSLVMPYGDKDVGQHWHR